MNAYAVTAFQQIKNLYDVLF